LRNVLLLAGLAIATQAAAQVTFYEQEGFAGRSFTAQKQVDNFQRLGFAEIILSDANGNTAPR